MSRLMLVIALAISGCGVLADSSVSGGSTKLERDVRTEPPRRVIRVRPPGVPMQECKP